MIWFGADRVSEWIARHLLRQRPIYPCTMPITPRMRHSPQPVVFPTFVLYQGSIVISSRASADTTKVCQWLKKMA